MEISFFCFLQSFRFPIKDDLKSYDGDTSTGMVYSIHPNMAFSVFGKRYRMLSLPEHAERHIRVYRLYHAASGSQFHAYPLAPLLPAPFRDGIYSSIPSTTVESVSIVSGYAKVYR